ncbi:retrovirus-related Pol polyprotein from transposon opus [Trichonephila clavipes]|nr:retrovirus-related Pol polyprotein from transposon opus [Trichonephila clavipes]
MSFGLRNAPSTFQRFITEVLYGLDFVFPYLDHVLVASSTEEEHSEHLKMVFERFQQYGLRINVSKSVMGAAQVEYLGFLITAEGSLPLPEKVQAILNYKLPETIHDLRTFLGMINFYRRYLKDAAKTQAPLHELLRGEKKKDRRKVHWTDDTRRSFEKCKTDLAEAALLSFPRSGLPLSLCTDASDFAVGAVLQQLENEDALSRIDSISEINFEAIAEDQTTDEELQQLLLNNSLKFKPSTLPSGKKLWCDTSTQKIRPYIPQKFRFQIFQLIHGLAHPGIKCTVKLMTEKYVEKWICRFGVPAKLVTDQGRQFEEELFRSIAAICGAKVAHTTSYHPQCNGKVERLHRTLKGAIKAHNNIRWTESLPTVLGLRSAIKPDISYTIAQRVYGTSIKLPGEFFDPPTINMDPQNFVAKLQQHMAELKPLKSPSNRKQNIFVHKDLKSCSHVFIRIDRVKKH